MQDAWRAYLELALGVTEASRKKARKVAKDLVGKGGATAAQLQSFADDLVTTSRKNREGLARLVRYEVERALGALGLATADEMSELSNRIRDLERQLRDSGAVSAPAPTTAASAAAQPTASKTTAKKTVAKKTVAKKAAPAKTTTVKTAAPRTTAAKAAASKATAADTTGGRTAAAKKATAPSKATG